MSVAVMTTCWKHSRARGTDLLVLLALADIANDDGECWPSIPHLAKKCRIDTRTTQRRIRSLEELGEVIVVVGGGRASKSGGPASNRYRITVYIPDDGTGDGGNLPPRQSAIPGTDATGGVAHAPPLGVAPVPPESSVEPSKEPSLLPVVAEATPARRQDPLFDALADVCGIASSDLTSSARGAMNRALADLRKVDAEPVDVRDRADVYRRRWPNVSLTPTALVKHWPTLDPNNAAPTDAIGRAAAFARKAGR